MSDNDGTVGAALASDWVQGCEYNTADELVAAIHEFARRLSTVFEVCHGDASVGLLARALREAADEVELEFGERVGHGERLMSGAVNCQR